MSDSLDVCPGVTSESRLEYLDSRVSAYHSWILNRSRSSGSWYTVIVKEEGEFLVIFWIYPSFDGMEVELSIQMCGRIGDLDGSYFARSSIIHLDIVAWSVLYRQGEHVHGGDP